MAPKGKDGDKWNKIIAFVAVLALIIPIAAWVYGMPIGESFSEAQKYFILSVILTASVFIYFQVFKE
jgi:hypothetical protein